MKSNVYLCYTVYHLYLTLLICKEDEKNIIVLTDFTDSLSNYAIQLKELGFISDVIYIRNEEFEHEFKNNKLIKKIVSFMGYKKSLIKKYEEDYPILQEIYRENIYMFVDEAYLSRYFLYKSNSINLLDDGEGNYFPRKLNIKYLIRHYVFRIPKGKGLHKSIETIQFRYPEKLERKYFNKIKHKLKKFDLNELETGIKHERRKSIQKIFKLDFKKDEMNKSALIMTQPFSEDGFIEESYKIKIYKDIVQEYLSKGYRVYVKPHPREKTIYEKYFPKETLIDKNIPTECFNLTGEIRFDVGVAIQSTALSNAKFIIDKVMLGYGNFPELKKGKELKDAIKIDR